MSFESLRHTPEFELPPNAPGAPADLVSLIEECYEGLAKAIVSKMIRRNKYEQIAVIYCQENPTKKTRPEASADDIADYCMMCMQYDIEKTDIPGTYKVLLIGPPGRARFERSKHIDLGDDDGMGRSKTMLTEGELIEQQSQYIGELHSQSVAVLETLHGMVQPLLKENKEMMKIISESARRLAEVERDRMRYELEIKIHNDEMKIKEAEEEAKNQRWRESMDVIKESGMVEGLMKALIKKMHSQKKSSESDNDDNSDDVSSDYVNKESSGSDGKKTKKSRVDKAKEKIKKKRKKDKAELMISKSTQKAIDNNEDLTKDQLEEIFEASGISKAKENPLALMVEVLKMSIDENDQWEIIEDTLSEEQFKLFKEITETRTDEEIEKKLKELYALKGSRRFLKLEQQLHEDQQGYIERLTEVAMSD